jgi:hypothetical protein
MPTQKVKGKGKKSGFWPDGGDSYNYWDKPYCRDL